MKNIFFLLFVLIYSASAAQNEGLIARYDSTAIYFDGVRGFIKNEQFRPLGVFFGKIAPEFQASPQGKLIFQKARKNRIASVATFSFGYALVTVGSILVAAHLDDSINRSVFDNRNKLRTGGAMMLGGVVMMIGGSFQFRKGIKHLNHAVWLRNREILLGR